MKKKIFLLISIVVTLFVAMPAYALIIQLGDQDFTDGQFIPDAPSFDAVSAGEPVPFDQLYGADPSEDFNQSWTFNFVPGSLVSASITIGIFDHDSQATGSQLDFFGFDGNDLTSLLDALFESTGGAQREYNVYTVDIPDLALADLSDGVANFTLTLQGPSLLGDLPGNGAGLDFARLSSAPVPEPATILLLGTGLVGLAGLGRKKFFKQQ